MLMLTQLPFNAWAQDADAVIMVSDVSSTPPELIAVGRSAIPIEPEPESPPVADDAALAADLQHALEEFQALQDTLGAARSIPPDGIKQWRSEKALPAIDSLLPKLEELAKRSGGQADVLLLQALCHAKRAGLYLDERREFDAVYGPLKRKDPSQLSADDRRQMETLAAPRYQAAKKVADEFDRAMVILADALRAAEALREGRAATAGNLVRGVVLAQSAIVSDKYIESADDARVSPRDVRSVDMAALLDDARDLLSKYVDATPRDNGLEWVRGQFYLAVVEYRGSLVQRKPGDGEEFVTQVRDDRRQLFKQAKARFATLKEPSDVLAILEPAGAAPDSTATMSFKQSGFAREREYTADGVANFYAASANLYLGLVEAIDPETPTDDPTLRRKNAEPFLNRAAELDKAGASMPTPTDSLTSGTIPLSVDLVRSNLVKAEQATGERQPLNDFKISFGVASLYDTNVILLGRETEVPLDLGRKRDFRVGTTFRGQYVLDLDAFDKNNDFLKKWQVLVEGRTAATWNARIHSFNEQVYGSTINLRYELAGQAGALNGLYLHNRYDYDYFLLGNDGFLRSNRLRPTLQAIAFEQVLDFSLFFNYEDRNYLEALRDERFDRDGNYFSWGFDSILDLGKWVSGDSLWKQDSWGWLAPLKGDRDYERPMKLRVGLEFNTTSTQGWEFDYESQILTAGLDFPLPYGIDFRFTSLFEWQDYRGGSLVDRQRRGRDDFVQEYGFRLERSFYLTRNYSPDNYEHVTPFRLDRTVMTLYGDLRFTIDDSNVRDRLGQSIYEYDRVIYGAGLRFDIN